MTYSSTSTNTCTSTYTCRFHSQPAPHKGYSEVLGKLVNY